MDEWDLSEERIRPPKARYGWVIWLIVVVVVGVGALALWKMRDDLPELVAQMTIEDAGVAEPPPPSETPGVDAGEATTPRQRLSGDELLRKLASRGAPDL